MTKRQAHAVLNAAIAGLQVPLHEINEALMLTGDFNPCESTPCRDFQDSIGRIGRSMSPHATLIRDHLKASADPLTTSQIAADLSLPVEHVRHYLMHSWQHDEVPGYPDVGDYIKTGGAPAAGWVWRMK